ncbi:alkaline phosphatase [Dysgonomonas sp. BGC7]|uniref:alkaline phosphatase n=1 Tax=Dysgonomonas sp. BGC7 TaxID=1658008 RepID=UPI00067F94C3|nr:alkaline phosphatase [Dysgonomonas sp. BGC7]MBD8389356.1 alkaline phosphatase [Dysgonomonas sp. BGC7]
MKLRHIFLLGLILLSSVINAQQKVKNVIFMIGDGMGLAQIYRTQQNKGDLTLLQFPYVGLQKTNSSNNDITDSAAAGTALSSGVKTKNGMLGLTPDSVKTISIMELAKKNGFLTGITVTCSVTHATPAAYYAHQPHREMHEEIASDLLLSNIDVCIGGGKKFFTDRKDNRDLLKELEAQKYKIALSQEDLENIYSTKVIALLADEHLPKMSEGRGDMLPNSVSKMLSLLNKENKKGFFVMVEGSQIDWGGHANDAEYVVNEVLDFDKAVKRALDFAAKDGHTLVIVTADHETGGMSIIEKDNKIKENFATTNHSATPVPVFAYGPGAETFTGYYDNTEFVVKIKSLLGLQ